VKKGEKAIRLQEKGGSLPGGKLYDPLYFRIAATPERTSRGIARRQVIKSNVTAGEMYGRKRGHSKGVALG